MLVRKIKKNLLKKKPRDDDTSSEENVQSLRSWIHKIEQSTTAVSSRLSAVEKRLSTGLNESDASALLPINGRVETLVTNIKKKNAGAVARVLDHELTFLHNELMDQKKEFTRLRDQLTTFEEMNTTTASEINVMRTSIIQMNETINLQMDQKNRAQPFVMHLGTIEIPIELTGIIGGVLAFTIAILVFVGQKDILLSPVFLCGVGILLIGVALSKMIRARSRRLVPPYLGMAENETVPSSLSDLPEE